MGDIYLWSFISVSLTSDQIPEELISKKYLKESKNMKNKKLRV